MKLCVLRGGISFFLIVHIRPFSHGGKFLNSSSAFTALDYVFVIDHKNYMSKLLAVTAWGDTLVTDTNTGEPMRNKEYVLMLVTPDRKDREYISGKTDDNGRIKQRGLRKIGDWKIIM